MSNGTCPPFLTPAVVFFLVLPGILGLGATPVQAQHEEGTGPPEALHPGAWALQFGVGENFTLNAFRGVTLSAKRHLSTPSALQAGLTVDVSATSRENEIEEQVIEDKSDTERGTLTLHYVLYPALGGRDRVIEPFFGVGPLVSFRHSGSRRTVDGEEQFRDSSREWGVGLSGMIGAEWFVHEQIGLHVAYETVGRFEWESSNAEVEGEDVPRPTVNRFNLDADGVRFGLSVYF